MNVWVLGIQELNTNSMVSAEKLLLNKLLDGSRKSFAALIVGGLSHQLLNVQQQFHCLLLKSRVCYFDIFLALCYCLFRDACNVSRLGAGEGRA